MRLCRSTRPRPLIQDRETNKQMLEIPSVCANVHVFIGSLTVTERGLPVRISAYLAAMLPILVLSVIDAPLGGMVKAQERGNLPLLARMSVWSYLLWSGASQIT